MVNNFKTTCQPTTLALRSNCSSVTASSVYCVQVHCTVLWLTVRSVTRLEMLWHRYFITSGLQYNMFLLQSTAVVFK